MGDLVWNDLRERPAGPVVWIGSHATSRPVPVPAHALAAWQVCAAVSGGLVMRVDGAIVRVPGGSWLLVPPGTELASAGVVRGRIVWIGLDPAAANDLGASARRTLAADLHRRAGTVQRGSEALHAAATRVIASRDPWARLAAGLSVVAALAGPGPVDAGVAPALAAISGEPAHPWTVAVLAARCGLAPARFHARFRSATGATPHEAVVAARLELARARLAAGATVAQAAAASGFASVRGFERAHARVHGAPPRGRRGGRRFSMRDAAGP